MKEKWLYFVFILLHTCCKYKTFLKINIVIHEPLDFLKNIKQKERNYNQDTLKIVSNINKCKCAEFDVICIYPILFEILKRTREIDAIYCDEHMKEQSICT